MAESDSNQRPRASTEEEEDHRQLNEALTENTRPAPQSPRSVEESVPASPNSSQFVRHENRDKTKTSESVLSRAAESIRRASVLILDDGPTSLTGAAGNAVATAPGIADIRRGSFAEDGWSIAQRPRSRPRRSSDASRSRRLSSPEQRGSFNRRSAELRPVLKEAADQDQVEAVDHLPTIVDTVSRTGTKESERKLNANDTDNFPKLPWSKTWSIWLKATARWVVTFKGAFITIYMLNVIAWGGMLFLLLCKAAPAMCNQGPKGCDDFDSPRRKWIEIDMQILNGFFCLTGFGLAPWRFRDTWLLLVWRGIVTRDIKKREVALRKLAGIHNSWIRLRGCEEWKQDSSLGVEVYNNDPTVPLPMKNRLEPPITGVRAPPTKYWKMDALVWLNLWNTLFQAFLAAFMWAYNRRTRPSWTTSLFISLAFGVAIAAGLLIYLESRRVKNVEGRPISPEKLAAYREMQSKADLEAGGEKAPVGFTAALRRSLSTEDHGRTQPT